jgi:hypothetical protein
VPQFPVMFVSSSLDLQYSFWQNPTPLNCILRPTNPFTRLWQTSHFLIRFWRLLVRPRLEELSELVEVPPMIHIRLLNSLSERKLQFLKVGINNS